MSTRVTGNVATIAAAATVEDDAAACDAANAASRKPNWARWIGPRP